ncbi:Tyrosine recombinase XerC [Lysinibacillus sphaericus]|nr:Tyrosine recombinase XerC [Lysinibacillus sphaericus]
MAIEKKMKVSIEDICRELGTTENDLMTFLETKGKNVNNARLLAENKTAIFVIDQYQVNLENMVNLNKRSMATFKTYNNFLLRVKSFLSINYPNMKINELNEIVLNEIINEANTEKKTYSVRTINKYNAIMKSLLKFAYQMNYIEKDLRDKFTIEKTFLLPRYLKQDHIFEILKTVKTFPKPDRCRAIIMFLLLTGCRVGETSRLKLRDFDIENNLIYIYNGKGDQDRIIPMFEQLKEEILLYLRKGGMETWEPNCEGYLFARDEGTERKKKITIRTIEHLAHRIRNRIPSLPHFTPHSFRHTFAVYCLKVGIKEHIITQILGHSDPKTTMVYTQLHGEDLRAV